MSGDHNKYCSGNQPDIVQRLRDRYPQGTAPYEAADEIERLRGELEREKRQRRMAKGLMDRRAEELTALRAKIDSLQPVAWWEQDESTLSFKTFRGGAWTPLYDLSGLE